MVNATDNGVLDRVIESMREPIRQFTGLVRHLAGGNTKGLTLYGAIVAGSFDAKRQSARSILVFETVDLEVLREFATHGTKLGQVAIAAPLIMTPRYIERSLDTYPLELIEISQQHLTLFGDDYFRDLTFEKAHVRIQCERELKGLLIGMRQGLLNAAGREAIISALEVDLAEVLVRTLRGMLWLDGSREAIPAIAVVERVEELTDRRLPGARAAVNPNAQHGWEEFQLLYRDIEALGDVADGW
ncbi:MAG: hypothetical protein IID36_12615 [Planctomycetes bacterium]|nr:hypothetical protein [Planctomycetota bacterium]